jgi:hypothetical protein
MKPLYTLFTAVLLCSSSLFAQKDVVLTIHHELNGQKFQSNTAAVSAMGHDFKSSRMEYYLTKFSIIHDGGQVTAVPNDIIALVDASQETNIALGSFQVTNIEGVKFHVGVYDPINHDDPSAWPQGHPLSPKIRSMHWGWTSGYRFIAFEGKGGSNYDQTIELHGLGDNNYFETSVNAISIDNQGVAEVQVYAEYTRAFDNIIMINEEINHSEEGTAKLIIENFRDYVYSGSSIAGLVDNKLENTFKVYPNPTEGVFKVEWSEFIQPTSIEVYSLSGRNISSHLIADTENEQTLSIEDAGVYLLKIISKSEVITKKISVK